MSEHEQQKALDDARAAAFEYCIYPDPESLNPAHPSLLVRGELSDQSRRVSRKTPPARRVAKVELEAKVPLTLLSRFLQLVEQAEEAADTLEITSIKTTLRSR